MFFFFNKTTSHGFFLPGFRNCRRNFWPNFSQRETSTNPYRPEGSFRPLYGLMGCGSSNASATAPEANVVKQRRRLSVGNVDTSDLVRFSLYFFLGKDIWFDGLWGALGSFGDVHGYYTHTSFFCTHFCLAGLGFERTSLHLFLWGV